MAAKQKKDTELVSSAVDTNQSSTITYANEVVAIIAGVAASEVDGIAGMCNVGGSGILNKNRNITRGVKVEIGTEEVSVDLYIIVEYGMPIQKAAHNAQENVRKAIESMTGLHVVRVDVHVQGVSFEKENSTGILLEGSQHAALTGENPEREPAAEFSSAQEASTAVEKENNAEEESVAEKISTDKSEAEESAAAVSEVEEAEEIPVEISFDDEQTEAVEEETGTWAKEMDEVMGVSVEEDDPEQSGEAAAEAFASENTEALPEENDEL